MAPVYSKDPLVDRSLRHSVRDGVATSAMSGGGESYFSAFALHFRATTTEIALLASLPLLIGSLAQLISSRFGHHIAARRTIVLAGAGMQTLSWIPLIVLPLAFPDKALGIILLCLMLYHASGSLAAPQWTSLMGDLVPERHRGRYFARRNRLASATSFTAFVSAGFILDRLSKTDAFTGFIAIFTMAAAARAVAVTHLARMHDPVTKPASITSEVPPQAPPLRPRKTPFTRFSLFHALLQFSVAIAGPFFTVYMLRDLHFTYLEFTANTAAAVLFQFLTLGMWGRMTDAFGNRIVLIFSGFLIPTLPALWLVSSDFWYLLLVQVLSGVLWAGYSLSAGNYLFDVVPPERRSSVLAYHNVRTNVGICSGALLGGFLGASLPESFSFGGLHLELGESALGGVFLLSALLRLLVAAVFLPGLKEGRSVRKPTLRSVALRLTRSRRLLRLLGLRRRAKHPATLTPLTAPPAASSS